MIDFSKIIIWFFKLYFTIAFFSILSIIILYASADTINYISTGESLICYLFNNIDTISDLEATSIVFTWFKIAIGSIAGYDIYDSILDVAFESGGGQIFSFVLSILEAPSTVAQPFFKSLFTLEALRATAVGSLAAIVIIALMNIKERFVGRSISTVIAFSFAMLYWLLAAYTFGEAVTMGLETRITGNNRAILYIVLIIAAVGFDILVDAFLNGIKVFRVFVIFVLRTALNIVRSAFAWLICAGVLMFNLDSIITSFIGLIVITATCYIEFWLYKAKSTKK